jgi:iron(III) transport system substrate-binding protein
MVVYPTDYVLTLSRVAFITASAKHPAAAKLFLNYLLSAEGQRILKSHSIGSIRADIGVPNGQPPIESPHTQAIRIGPGLLADLDRLVRAQFLRRWHDAFKAGSAAGGIAPSL